MKTPLKAILKSRATANQAIALTVFCHLALVFFAATFETDLLRQAAFASGVALYFVVGPILWFWHRTTLPNRPAIGLSDIRKTTEAMGELSKYDPEPYFNLSAGIFVGLDIDKNNEPIYVPWSRIRKTHMQVVGTTGSGKGVATTMMLSQCALDGECVVIYDPKFPGDEFASRVLNRLAQNHGIPFYLINLAPTMPPPFDQEYPQTPPQLNLFRGCTQSELEELLMTAFDLGDKGNTADFYRLYDRLACQDVCERATANGNSPNIKDILTAVNKSRKIDSEKGQKFKANLEEIAKLPVLNTAEGHDLRTILDQNAILYIIGSTRNAQVTRVQKMLLLRILQLIEQRDRNKKLRPVAIMLDELKYLLSKPALQALGTVRDKSCHIFLAHQTNGDLRDCEGLDPEAVSAAVKVNTSLKLIYRATDDQDAKWASNLSGTIVVQQESSHMQQGMFDAAEGQYRQTERPLMTINELLSLPDLTGMFFGLGLSRRIQVGPMKFATQPRIIAAKPLEDAKVQGKQPKDKKAPQEQKVSIRPSEAQESRQELTELQQLSLSDETRKQKETTPHIDEGQSSPTTTEPAQIQAISNTENDPSVEELM